MTAAARPTGIYDLRFAIWDAATNGNVVAGPLTNSATGVTNGLFAVTLDFGAGVFTGPARWLELDVRTNGGGAFITLLPLQPIKPVPYAIMANTASNLLGTLPAAQLSGIIPLVQMPGAVLTNNSSGVVLNGTFSGNGAGSNLDAAVATNAPNGIPLNNLANAVMALPFAELHPNTTFTYNTNIEIWVKSNVTASATITINGVTTNYYFPGSTDAGWNELQATMATIAGGLYWFQQGRPSVGWQLYIDAGEFDIQQRGLMITNNENIYGAGIVSTVFVFNGSTNGFTQLNLTKNPESCALFDIETNGISASPYFNSFAYQVSINNLSIKTAVNIFCVGLFNNGWNTYLNHVYVGGPAYLNAPFWTIGWVPTPTASQEMIGIYCGNQANNDQVIEHCAAYDCADGLVLAGSTLFAINDFTASQCAKTPNGYSKLSELSLGFGIGAIYTGGPVYNTKIDGYQADNCNVAAYVNYNTTEVDFNHCFLQANNYPIALLDGEPPYGYVAPVSFESGPVEGTTVFVDVTNDDSGNYVIDGKHTINPLAVSTIYLPNGIAIDPVWQLTVGNTNAITVTSVATNQVNIGAGFTLAGSGSGLTNLSASAIIGGFNTNILVGGHTFYITNGIIMNVQ